MLAVVIAAETAAETAAARSDSGVEVDCDEVVTARTCEVVEVMSRRGGSRGGGEGGGGGGGRWSLAASTARCSSAPLQRSCGSCSI